MMKTIKREEEDSDNEKVPDFYFPRKEDTRANAVRRLRLERENAFVESMLGSLQSDIDKSNLNRPQKLGREKFDPVKLTNNCISSWRNERLAILSSIAEHTKKNPDEPRIQRNRKMTQYRKEPAAVELNSFLKNLHQQIGEAAMELENLPRKKFVLKEENILSRPSQLTKLAEIVAGTEEDDLRDAQKRMLGKLSKTCAYWMTHRNTPQEHRPAVEKELEEVHGELTDAEKIDYLNQIKMSKPELILEEPSDVESYSLGSSYLP